MEKITQELFTRKQLENFFINKVINIFKKEYKPYVIGKVLKGKNKVILNGKINW